MLSRERVKKALEFQNPDRVPRSLWVSPSVEETRMNEIEDLLEEYPRDMIDYREVKKVLNYTLGYSKAQKRSLYKSIHPEAEYGEGMEPGYRYVDEWGCIWCTAEKGRMGEVEQPTLKSLKNVDSMFVPWGYLDALDLSEVDKNYHQTDKFVLSEICAHPFERMQHIRGTSNLFKDLARQKEELIKLRDKVHEYNLKRINKWLETDVDGIFILDDWGGQNNLLISPEMWRNIFKPLYKEYVDLVHEKDKYVFFHSDGRIEEIFEDLVNLGIDAINSQLYLMDFDMLGYYKGEVTFWGEVDRQNILRADCPDRVREFVEKIQCTLGNESGGTIAQCKWEEDHHYDNIRSVFYSW